MEKQKLRFNYGLTETQLRRVVADAKKDRGATGDKLVELLERRLDNLVFRAGFAPTIPAARQLVSHGKFQLNGKRVTIPSIRLARRQLRPDRGRQEDRPRPRHAGRTSPRTRRVDRLRRRDPDRPPQPPAGRRRSALPARPATGGQYYATRMKRAGSESDENSRRRKLPEHPAQAADV